MGLLDSISNVIVNKLAGEDNGPIAKAALNLFNEYGGLPGIVDKLSESGLGQQVASWVSTNTNLPVTPDEIKAAIGESKIAELAQQMGITEEDMSAKIAEYLPKVIDKLTPNGEVPADNSAVISQVLSMLKK